jgi:polyphosphate kinase 2 (PPK2 family)
MRIMAKKRKKLTDTTPDAYEFHVHKAGSLQLAEVDLDAQVKDKARYEDELEKLQRRLYELQVQLFLEKRKAIFVFEGWDAAGKGGAIKRLTALMDPRGYKVWPIAAPKDAEGRHHYLWRFVIRLPDEGEIAIFDRSWYGRVLVERVEGFAKTKEWNRAYDEINAFETMMTSDGVVMGKFFLHIGKDEQLKRFRAREDDPVKSFKIGEEDWRNRKKWSDYEEAIQDMLDRTHRPDAPWFLVPANDKRHARLSVLRTCVKILGG